MQRTIESLSPYFEECSKYRKNPVSKSKLDYALDKMSNLLRLKLKRDNKKLDRTFVDNKIKYASTDEHKNLIIESITKEVEIYAYTTENRNKLETDNRIAIDNYEKIVIEFDPYIVPKKDVPKDLTVDQIEAFKGIVISEDYELTFEEIKE